MSFSMRVRSLEKRRRAGSPLAAFRLRPIYGRRRRKYSPAGCPRRPAEAGPNGVDMDALIKPLREAKPAETPQAQFRPAELDPSEFLLAAVRADQPRPSRAEAERAVATLLGYIGEDT